jgi:ribosomal protein L7/L12
VGKVFVVIVLLFVLAFALGMMLRRRDRGTELFVTEARGHQYEGPLEDQLMALMRQRKKILAIKLLRERTGLGLKEAKDAVEALERTGRLHLPGDNRDLKQAYRSDDPAEFVAEARRLKEQRRAIEAIKLIRTHTGLGLKEAKDFYDRL